ncbi:unnamed protein product [Chrysodeixis includens]|uniref:Uncharacterized protein n=1 Tax=Chrysodeixis includens TaxID=689277 RepID=A0A9N8L158_CHRIL|nr:unnamed protein product [Chrysodeixis includens]
MYSCRRSSYSFHTRAHFSPNSVTVSLSSESCDLFVSRSCFFVSTRAFAASTLSLNCFRVISIIFSFPSSPAPSDALALASISAFSLLRAICFAFNSFTLAFSCCISDMLESRSDLMPSIVHLAAATAVLVSRMSLARFPARRVTELNSAVMA